jgi:predicted Fe-S protein YdhL (DUF1289 family)
MPSPCQNRCQLNAANTCTGCGRTLGEIAQWSAMPKDQQQWVMDEVLPARARLRQEIGHTLPGIPGHRLTRADFPRVAAHFASLEKDALRARFGHPTSPEAVSRWLDTLDWDITVLWGIGGEASGRATPYQAVAILDMDAEARLEVGLSVLAPFRNKGLGSRLLEATLAMGHRVLPAGTLVLHIAPEAHPLRHLVTRHGGTLNTVQGETTGLFTWSPPV